VRALAPSSPPYGDEARVIERIVTTAALDLVELAYAPSTRDVWSKEVLAGLLRLTPRARTACLFEVELRDVEGGLQLTARAAPEVLGDDLLVPSGVHATERTPSAMLAKLFGRTHASTASEQTGEGERLSQYPIFRQMWKAPIEDSLALMCRDPNGQALVAFVGLAEVARFDPRDLALLTKVAVHVGAGRRLRDTATARNLDGAEAVLSATGKLLYGSASAQKERAALDDGRRRRDWAKSTRHDPEQALDVWRGLVAARWSLVDYFDTDGKRFVVAMKNAPEVDRIGTLGAQELRVVALVAMGHRDKEVAYMLGLSLGAVTSALHRARAKLGVRSRAGLAALWRRGRSR
jgi:DNA-binding CsgD family transcriptional regulator